MSLLYNMPNQYNVIIYNIFGMLDIKKQTKPFFFNKKKT